MLSNKTGINMGNVKNYNHSSILNLLNNFGPMSRKDIAAKLKLTPAAVTLMCSEMIEKSILLEMGEVEEKKVGRKKVLIDINYEYRYILFISIEAHDTFFGISNLKGNLICIDSIKTEISMGIESFIKKITDKCKDFMWRRNINKEKILGIGVGIVGSIMTNDTYKNQDIEIKKVIEDQLDLPVVLRNNVKAFAQAELIYGGGKLFNNILFLKWGPGVGGTIVIDKKIYQGENNKSAEIGHYIVDIKGKQCKCGKKGCLETEISYKNILEKVERIFSKKYTPQLYEKLNGDINLLTIENIDILFHCKDIKIKEIIENIMINIAQAVVNINMILSINQIILFGEIIEKDSIVEQFINYCNMLDKKLNRSYISKSSLSDKIKYIGPVSLVYNELFLGNVCE